MIQGKKASLGFRVEGLGFRVSLGFRVRLQLNCGTIQKKHMVGMIVP